jgi:hypothetical protein
LAGLGRSGAGPARASLGPQLGPPNRAKALLCHEFPKKTAGDPSSLTLKQRPIVCFRLAGSDTLNLFPSELSIYCTRIYLFDG